MPVEQGDFIGGRQVAVVRHALVKIVCNEIEDVLFKVRAGAGDGVNFSLADHFGERKTQLCCTHGSAHGQEHLAAAVDKLDVAFCCVYQGCGVEMPVMMLDKFLDCQSKTLLAQPKNSERHPRKYHNCIAEK